MTRSSLLRRCGVVFATAAIVAAVLITAAAGGVSAPQSGWYSGNPLLGPNMLEDVVCSDPTCYATGTFGTVLKSSDAGATWSGVVTGATANLLRARLGGGAFDQLVTGGNCTMLYSHDAADHFARLPFTASDDFCRGGLAAFSFPTNDTGYIALLTNDVLSTADAGQSFTRRTALPTGTVTDLLCVSTTTCFATVGSTIQKTTDGAGSWTQVYGGVLALNGIVRAGPTAYYAVGQGLTVLKSVDGGSTWTKLPVDGTPPGDLTKIRCSGALVCLIATQAGNQILRTDDGGTTFSSIVPSTDPTYAVEFASVTRAIAAGAAGSVEVSDDAGKTWRAVGTRVPGSFSLVAAGTGSVAYAAGANGVMARTADGGRSWQAVGAPTSAAIVSVAAPTAAIVYALAADGTLERSDNGGASYKLLGAGDPTFTAVVATDAEHVLLFGAHGVRKSSDGGASFAPVDDPDARTLLLRAQVRGSTVFAYSRRRLIVSTDAGSTWRRIPLRKGMYLTDVSFVSPKLGYVVSNFNVWRTSDAGRTWRYVESIGPSFAYGVHFADAKHGYVIVNRYEQRVAGFVLRTDDGGTTWHPQLVSPFGLHQIVSAGGTDYAFADDSVLYATTTGGDVGAAQTLTLSVRKRTVPKPQAITVTGRLKPADGGERVEVGMHTRAGWDYRVVVVAANGTFSTRWQVRRGCEFVAQVLGDATHAGAATKLLPVAVRRR